MTQSKKRRSSMSPEPAQLSEVPELKRRKLSCDGPTATTSSTIATQSVARSPEPEASDSSSTLDGDTPPSKDKGKAVEKDPLAVQLELLQEELVQKNELLEKRQQTVTAMVQALTCRICLELLEKPYALSPCGHVSCHRCLVEWFTAPHNDHDRDEDDPNTDWYSDYDGASVVSEQPDFGEGSQLPNPDTHANPDAPPSNPDAHANPDAPPPNPDAHANPDASLPNPDAHANPDAPPPNPDAPANPNPPNGDVPPVSETVENAPPPPAAPTRNGYPNSIFRRKTCPHCRCVVMERPVQLYVLKDLVGIVGSPDGKKKDDSGKDNDKKDPWKGIFRPPRGPGPGPGHGGGGPSGGPGGGPGGGPSGGHGGHGGANPGYDSDGGIGTWHGFTPWIGPPPGGAHGQNPASAFSDNEQDAPVGPHFSSNLWFGDHAQEDSPSPGPLPQPFIDREDGVRRCGNCLHELWHGACTNRDCGIVYEEASEVATDEDNDRSPPHHHGHTHSLEDDEDDEEDDGVVLPSTHDDDEEDDDGYESSFIDDAVPVQGSLFHFSPVEHEEDDFIRRSPPRLTRQNAVIFSFESENEPGPSTVVRRGRGRLIVDDESVEELEVEEDVISVDDNGSSSVTNGHGYGSPSSAASSANHSVVVEDTNDDENYTDVPYVWEEYEDEGEDGGQADDGGDDRDDEGDLHVEEGSGDDDAY